MGGNKDCSPKKVSVLGQVSGILVRNTAPRVNNVIWAYPIGFNDANEQVYSLRIYNGAAWVEILSGSNITDASSKFILYGGGIWANNGSLEMNVSQIGFSYYGTEGVVNPTQVTL